jgi:hypothetical protein
MRERRMATGSEGWIKPHDELIVGRGLRLRTIKYS